MTTGVDRVFGIHAEALQLRARRGEVLASNLANADTPNYKARDLDFKAVLSETQSQSGLTATRKGHIRSQGSEAGVHMKYSIPAQPSLDGNTVDTQIEQNKFSENAVRYRASLRFISGRIHGLMTAIKGE